MYGREDDNFAGKKQKILLTKYITNKK